MSTAKRQATKAGSDNLNRRPRAHPKSMDRSPRQLRSWLQPPTRRRGERADHRGRVLGAEWAFVRLTGALQIDTGAAASAAIASKEAAANHDLLAIAMLLGAIVGLIASMGVQDPTAKSQVITLLILPIPLVSALALGIAIGNDRVVALVVIALVLAFGTYLRRFGPRGFLAGQLLFIGYFVGFSLHSAVMIGDLGWLAAEVCIGLGVVAVVRFGLF